jgi:hypothetical protein
MDRILSVRHAQKNGPAPNSPFTQAEQKQSPAEAGLCEV